MTWTQIYIIAGLIFCCICITRDDFGSGLREFMGISTLSIPLKAACVIVATIFVVLSWPYGICKQVSHWRKRRS